MADLVKIMAEAWAAERAKYECGYNPDTSMFEIVGIDAVPVFAPAHSDESDGILECERHIDALCASAVLQALQAAALAVVPVEPTDDMLRSALRVTRDDGYGHVHDATGGAVYRAMLAALAQHGEG